MGKVLFFFILFMIAIQIHAVDYKIKAYNPNGDGNWGFASGNYGANFRSFLLNPSNFGSGGVVSDVRFSSITDVSSITTSSLSDADIFILMFPYGSGWNINSTQAQTLKNFVEQGGSLIVTGDADNTYPAVVGSLFGGVSFYNGWASTGGSVSMQNSVAGVTTGPFGTVSSLSWGGNATTQITSAGNSTILDNWGMVSVIKPTGTSGSVVFYADTDAFISLGYYGASWQTLAGNVFAYSAHSAHSAVPEMNTVLLIASGILALLSKKWLKL